MKALFLEYKKLREPAKIGWLRLRVEFAFVIMFAGLIVLVVAKTRRIEQEEPWLLYPERYNKATSVHEGIFFDTKTITYEEK